MLSVLTCGRLEYWKWGAITAISFMAFASFLGWWYQRRMRLRFAERELPLLNSSPSTLLSTSLQHVFRDI